jgi:hypothetical protein
MEVYLLSAGVDIIGVFDADKKDKAERAAAMIGGELDGPFPLNQLPATYAKPPKGAAAFYAVELTKHGKVARVDALSLLGDGVSAPLGELRTERYLLETDGKRVWRLRVDAYAASPEEAVKRADVLRHKVRGGHVPPQGAL